MLDLKAIAEKFGLLATPEERAASEAAEANETAWHAEQSAWETRCHNEGISTEEFNRVRDDIDRRYGFAPTSEKLSRVRTGDN